MSFQDTELAALITPEASLEETGSLSRFFGSVETTAKCVSVVLHTVERGYRIQFGSPPPRCNGVNPTLVGPEQALVMEREVDTL